MLPRCWPYQPLRRFAYPQHCHHCCRAKVNLTSAEGADAITVSASMESGTGSICVRPLPRLIGSSHYEYAGLGQHILPGNTRCPSPLISGRIGGLDLLLRRVSMLPWSCSVGSPKLPRLFPRSAKL